MGLGLTRQDFVVLFKVPKPVLVGLFGQLLLMPALALGIALVFDLAPHLAIGLMILAACPGGTTSNVISHLARANLALSVTLTAITSLVCVFSTPVIIQFAIGFFSAENQTEFSLAKTTLGLIVITLLPVLLGMWIRRKFPNAAQRYEATFRHFSAIFMVVMVIAIVIQERDILAKAFVLMFEATIALNLLSIGAGVILGRLFVLSAKDTITLGIEVGIQNASMAMLIAVTFLQRPDYAISAAVYGLTMYLGAALLVWVAKRF
jgi:BASS family bile acid:Na+ symporter